MGTKSTNEEIDWRDHAEQLQTALDSCVVIEPLGVLQLANRSEHISLRESGSA